MEILSSIITVAYYLLVGFIVILIIYNLVKSKNLEGRDPLCGDPYPVPAKALFPEIIDLMTRKDIIRKLVIGIAGLVIVVISGIQFYKHRHMPEPVVIGDNDRRCRGIWQH
ncbi:MAG: hypothetical protein R2744_09265 [Bacteroidales bacterium]